MSLLRPGVIKQHETHALSFILCSCSVILPGFSIFHCQSAIKSVHNPSSNHLKLVLLLVKVLWPYLLEYIVPEQYTDAVPVLCKSICSVAKRLKESESEDFVIDFDKFGKFSSDEFSFMVLKTPREIDNPKCYHTILLSIVYRLGSVIFMHLCVTCTALKVEIMFDLFVCYVIHSI